MALPENELRDLARRAWEGGRRRAALAATVPVLPMIALSLFGCHTAALSLVLGAVLATAVFAVHHRGGDAARGIPIGLGAGLVPLVLPLLSRAAHLCSGGVCYLSLGACAAGGLIAGIAVGAIAARRSRALVSAVIFALLAGSLGCIAAGGAGLAGLAVGLTLGAIPGAALARARSAA